jgi:NSS family neurotransmitter:Na+ symporter
MGWLFGFLFFAGLFGAAYISDFAAFEVMVGGLVDNTKLSRKKAVFICCSVVYVLAIPPMINYKIFIPWDLIFGSGMQVLGSLLAIITVGWCMKRTSVLKELSKETGNPFIIFLYGWIRFAIPIAIIVVGINWLVESVF